jgi:hypothetical protein
MSQSVCGCPRITIMAIRRSAEMYFPLIEVEKTVDLGRLLVNIDDLDALMNLLGQGLDAESGEVFVQYNGGQFDEASDLRSLADHELAVLVVHAPSVYVVFSNCFASARGSADRVAFVEKWATDRRANLPTMLIAEMNRLPKTIVTIMMAISLSAILPLLASQLSIWDKIFWVSFALYISVSSYVLRRKFASPWGSYAIVHPVTHEHTRSENVQNRRHYRQTMIALFAVLIALSSLLVTIFLK